MSKPKRLRTILYGDQRVSNEELDLLNTPALQRLYELHQLGLTDRVFIDASHSRLHHVIGVLEQAERIANAIIRNLNTDPGRVIEYGRPPSAISARDLARHVSQSRPIIRLIGLLHDLTHAPYGHTVEDEINLVVCKHDEPKRQADAFYRLLCQYLGWLARDAGVSEGRDALGELLIPQELTVFLDEPDGPPPVDWSVIASFGVKLLGRQRTHPNCIFWRLDANRIAVLLANLHVSMTALLHLELLHKNSPKAKHIPDEAGFPFQKVIERILEGYGYKSFGVETRFQPRRDAFMLDH